MATSRSELIRAARDMAAKYGNSGWREVAEMIGALADEVERLRDGARRGGVAGGRARAEALTPERRSEIARLAVETRWRKAQKSKTEDRP